MELTRRILVALTIFTLAIASFVWFRGGTADRYGLLELLQGQQRPKAELTAPSAGVGAESALESMSPLRPEEIPLLSQLDQEYALLTSRVIPAVVSITTIRAGSVAKISRDSSGEKTKNQQFHQPGLGSGVLVSKEGHVLTNHHIIREVDGIEVTTHDGEAYQASIIGSDPLLDIAVLKIDSEKVDFPALPFGDSDEIQVGQSVIAAGNPLGLSGTITRGIISAKGRDLADGTTDLIQTDTVINPGSSGGPLVNTRGEIIGITHSIYKGGKEASGWQGVALAVPANSARETFETIQERGKPLFGYFGVTVGREVVSGAIAVVGIVEGSPAQAAQLELGDLILEFNGAPTRSAKTFLRSVLRSAPGEKISLKVLRQNKSIDLQAVMSERPDPEKVTAQKNQPIEKVVAFIRNRLGITSRNLTREELLRAGSFPVSPGVLIVDVDPGSPFFQTLEEGDLVMQINHLPVGDVNSFWKVLSGLPSGEEAVMYVIARGKKQALKFVPSKQRKGRE